MVQGGTAPQPLMQGSQMDSLKSSAEEIHNRLGVNSWWGLCSGFPLSLYLLAKKKCFPGGWEVWTLITADRVESCKVTVCDLPI